MEIIYRAFDGTEFTNKYGCEAHEHKLRNPMAMLAIQDHEMLSSSDVAGVKVGKHASCTRLEFSDFSFIEITHTDVKVFNADGTKVLAQFDRVPDKDLDDA